MRIQVLFFGATADIAGEHRVNVEFSVDATANDVFEKLKTEHPQLSSHRLHISLNQQYATGDEILTDGDELAIFTAVSGG